MPCRNKSIGLISGTETNFLFRYWKRVNFLSFLIKPQVTIAYNFSSCLGFNNGVVRTEWKIAIFLSMMLHTPCISALDYYLVYLT
jgi:hypothetical protein